MKNKIKDELMRQGITQKELAKRIGMTEVGLGRAINGSATRKTIEKAAQALEVDVDSLLVEEPVHYAKFSAEKTPLKLGVLEIPCYVLENGQRVFSGRGIQRVLGYGNSSGTWLSSYVGSPKMSSVFSPDKNDILLKVSSPIKFRRNDAGGSQTNTYGYDATLLIDICSAVLDAKEEGLNPGDKIVANANIIIRAVAKTGIIALVDEATGYDKERTRAKDELQKFLSQFLYDEAAKWVKTFPDQFFEDIYKMRGWNWNNASKRPGVVGNWIKDIVYNRLAPILPTLEKMNPSDGPGQRKHKHHQFLNEDIAKPKLKEHLAVVHALAVTADYDWKRFMAMLDKACPAKNQELFIDFGD